MKEMKDLMKKFSLKELLWMTIGIEIMVIGIYFFKFTNNFSFGGATGIAVILSLKVLIADTFNE